MDILSELQGPMGGLVAIGLFTGAMAGYTFAMKTVLAAANRRIEEMRTEMSDLRAELTSAREKYLEHLEKLTGAQQ